MSEIVAEHTALADEEHQQLGLLVSEWQPLADPAFSDLVLWVPDRDPNGFWAAAQIRPTTGPTALADDVVGDLTAYAPEHLVSGLAYLSGEIAQTSGEGAGPCRPVLAVRHPRRQWRLRYRVGLDHAVGAEEVSRAPTPRDVAEQQALGRIAALAAHILQVLRALAVVVIPRSVNSDRGWQMRVWRPPLPILPLLSVCSNDRTY